VLNTACILITPIILSTGKQAADLEENKKEHASNLIRTIAELPNPLKASNREKLEEDLEELQDMDDKQQACLTSAGVKKGRFEKQGYRRSSSGPATPPFSGTTEDGSGSTDMVAALFKQQSDRTESMVRVAEIKAQAVLETRKMELAVEKELSMRRLEIDMARAQKDEKQLATFSKLTDMMMGIFDKMSGRSLQ